MLLKIICINPGVLRTAKFNPFMNILMDNHGIWWIDIPNKYLNRLFTFFYFIKRKRTQFRTRKQKFLGVFPKSVQLQLRSWSLRLKTCGISAVSLGNSGSWIGLSITWIPTSKSIWLKIWRQNWCPTDFRFWFKSDFDKRGPDKINLDQFGLFFLN